MSTTINQGEPACFAMDPERTSLGPLSSENNQRLDGKNHLTTVLVDFVLHHGMKRIVQRYMLLELPMARPISK
jgi:hypothetical protein